MTKIDYVWVEVEVDDWPAPYKQIAYAIPKEMNSEEVYAWAKSVHGGDKCVNLHLFRNVPKDDVWKMDVTVKPPDMHCEGCKNKKLYFDQEERWKCVMCGGTTNGR